MTRRPRRALPKQHVAGPRQQPPQNHRQCRMLEVATEAWHVGLEGSCGLEGLFGLSVVVVWAPT